MAATTDIMADIESGSMTGKFRKCGTYNRCANIPNATRMKGRPPSNQRSK
eukprot:CAMPEP_0197836430 /NCGR_PEP_ID=MMETSP1437-20131217/28978_1 /TAXON_ID=49252 ORGANISM="Eucampia antarctica, Strain CCMP1452" /NCGR_SAMPLE_ID=MMETSP1437 /ASSEMBLY_ACC=CAM_ASM_001096 /LENGTH=49 /DNA_ID=CAMNT_0043442609 /DNA_START=409 /DNA_END=558 /DNA_ORIENTATION=+